MEKTWPLGLLLPRCAMIRKFNGSLPAHGDRAAKAPDSRAPDLLSELAPSSLPVHMHENLPGAGSTLKDPSSYYFSPSPMGPFSPDVRMRSIAPPRVGTPRTCKPAPPTRGLALGAIRLSEYIEETPVAQMDVEGRAGDGRNLSSPPKPRGGRREDESSKSGEAAMSLKGGKSGEKCTRMPFLPKRLAEK